MALLMVLALGGGLQAQSRKDRRQFQQALQLQNKQRFDKAAKLHERYLLTHKDWEAQWNLAYCYNRIGRPADAERLLTDLAIKRDDEPEFKLRLAEHLKRQGKYDAAATWYEKYARQSPDSLMAYRRADQCRAAKAARADSLAYAVQPVAAANSPADEFVPVLQWGMLVFVSNRNGSNRSLQAHRANDGGLSEIEPAGGGAVSDPPPPGPQLRVGQPGRGRNQQELSAMRDSLLRGELSIASQFGLRQDAVRSDGLSRLVALQLPGGFGGMDLYVQDWQAGEWSPPRNLGEAVNGPYNEECPFLTNDSTLFFSSDRPDGLGGRDIYSAECVAGLWLKVRHEAAPLNSPFDDFGFCMVPGQALGYLCSNRPGGSGGYDIWGFRRFKAVEGRVVDGETFMPRAGVRVDVVDMNQQHFSYVTDAQGRFRHVMRAGQEVFAQFFHPDYHDHQQNISTRPLGHDQYLDLDIPLQPVRRYRIEGVVTDAQTKAPLEGVTVRLVSARDERLFTNKRGMYDHLLQPASSYWAIFHLEGYIPAAIPFQTGPESSPRVIPQSVALKKGSYHYLEGRTVDTEREIVVGGATLDVIDTKTQSPVLSTTMPDDGLYYKVLPNDREYTVIASKEKYLSARIDVPKGTGRADTLLRNFELVPIMPDKVIKTVYFPYRSSTLDEAGFRELTEVIYLLRANTGMGIELIAHTDARGGAPYNKTLSQQRADALAAYVIGQGIEAGRVKAIGMGEERPFNNCGEGVTCSEELHSQNRRAEIKLVRLEGK